MLPAPKDRKGIWVQLVNKELSDRKVYKVTPDLQDHKVLLVPKGRKGMWVQLVNKELSDHKVYKVTLDL